MKKSGPITRALSVAMLVFAAAFLVNAQQSGRTWVSGVGDDLNPCSRTAPCRTFAGSITKTAPGGEINCLDSSTFGSVAITKSITIDCKAYNGGIRVSGTQAIVINAAAGIVRLRGLSIQGAGAAPGTNAISILSASRVNIEEVVIDGFSQAGIDLAVTGTSPSVFVESSSIRNNQGSGIGGVPATSADITIVNSSLTGNGTALLAAQNVIIRIAGNSIFYNTTGLSAQTRGQILSFGNNYVNNNGTDGSPTSALTAR